MATCVLLSLSHLQVKDAQVYTWKCVSSSCQPELQDTAESENPSRCFSSCICITSSVDSTRQIMCQVTQMWPLSPRSDPIRTLLSSWVGLKMLYLEYHQQKEQARQGQTKFRSTTKKRRIKPSHSGGQNDQKTTALQLIPLFIPLPEIYWVRICSSSSWNR